jgi:hypothetical protein
LGKETMPLSDLPGYSDIKAQLGECAFGDFPDLKCLTLDTYYEEDRERFEKIVSLVLKGKKGTIDVVFGNIRDFRLTAIDQLIGFEVKQVRDRGWEQANYEISDYEHDAIRGLAENCRVAVSQCIT